MAGTVTSAICASAKLGMAQKLYNFGTDTFKLALLKDLASLSGNIGALVTNYSTIAGVDELPATGNYTTGGVGITPIAPALGGSPATIVYWSFTANPQWTSASFTTAGGLIYDVTASNAAIAVLSWGGDKPVTNGTFTVTWPANAYDTAVLRIT